jgi:hypothetical protein
MNVKVVIGSLFARDMGTSIFAPIHTIGLLLAFSFC